MGEEREVKGDERETHLARLTRQERFGQRCYDSIEHAQAVPRRVAVREVVVHAILRDCDAEEEAQRTFDRHEVGPTASERGKRSAPDAS